MAEKQSRRKNPTPKKGQSERQKKPIGQQVIEFLKSIGFALIAVVILNSFVLASFQVPTGSMERTVLAGDLLFVNKYIFGGTTPPTIPILGILTGTEIEIPYFRLPGFRSPRQGDVIVFIFPGERDLVKARNFQYYLKRCVAVAGDTLEIREKQVFVNGKIFTDPEGVRYSRPVELAGDADPTIFPPGATWNRDYYGPIRIPKQGDVLNLTTDNIPRWTTFIRREGHSVEIRPGGVILIDGNETDRYTVERDYLFGMGDNRDDSLDSRFWGFIPEEYVIGTPIIVYWSWDPDISIFNLIKKIGSIRLSRIATLID